MNDLSFFGKATLDVKKGIHWMLISIPFFFFFCCFNSCFKGQFWVSYSLWIVDNLKHRSM